MISDSLKTEVPDASVSGQKQYAGVLGRVVTAIAIAYSLYHILYLLHVFDWARIWVGAETHRAISLGLVLFLTFILFPFRRSSSKTGVPWYDLVFALLSLVGTGYIVYAFDRVIIARGIMATNIEIALGFLTIILVLEATRRVLGWSLPVAGILFLIYSMFGNYFPGFFQVQQFSLRRIIGHMYLYPNGVFGLAMDAAATIIVAFIIFASFLQASGAGKFFLDLAFAAFGHVRGGPAKVAVVASALFGTISGSTTANVVSTGTFTIPLMKKAGYRPEFAGAVEAVASNGGQIMPPVMGAVAFLIAEFLQISYVRVIWAALLPAILYFTVLFLQVDFEAAKMGIRGLPRNELPTTGKTLRQGWVHILPIVLLFVMVGGDYTPERSALYSTAALLLVSLFRRGTRMGPGKIARGLESTARGMLMVTIACAAAGIIIGSLSLTGLGVRLSWILTEIAGGNLFLLLLLAAAASFILGMGMTSIPVYIMVVVTVAPALMGPRFNVPPIAAHMFVFIWALASFITPPVAVAAFAAAPIAGASPNAIGWQAVKLGIVTFIIPFMFVYNPALLMIGAPAQITLSALLALVAGFALAAALAGYVVMKLRWPERVALGAGAIALMVTGWWTAPVGLLLVAPPAVRQFIAWRAGRKRPGLDGEKSRAAPAVSE